MEAKYPNETPCLPPLQAQASARRADACTLIASAVCAGIYAFAQPSIFSPGFRHLPGIGLTLSVWLLLGLCAARRGVRNLHFNRQSLFLLFFTLLLSLTYALFANDALRAMNLPVLAGLTVLTAAALSSGGDLLSARGFCGALRRRGLGCLRHLGAPLRVLGGLRRARANAASGFGPLALGLFLCIPVAGLAALLLCDADAAFGASLARLLDLFRVENPGATLLNLLRALLLTLLLFAFLYNLDQRCAASEAPAPERSIHPLSFGMVLAVLCALYAAFVWLQFQHLIGGESVLTVNCAGYARSGFFQLVLVALITLATALPALSLCPRSRALRVLAALAVLLTAGILASAAWRMAVYIRAYGWTLLRMTTLWGMLAIAAALLGALIKSLRPRARIFRILAVFTIVSWTLFNFINVDARIAWANVSAYQRGAQEALDVNYLASLSPDALPALESLNVPDTEAALLQDVERARETLRDARPSWYDWSLSWRKLG